MSTFSLTFITIVANSAETTLLFKADTAGTDNQVDASTNSYTITEYGNVTSTAFSPYHPGGYSTYFDGTGDYIQVADGTYKTFGSNAFTVEGWFKADALSGTRYILGDGASSGQTNTSSINICTVGSNLTVYAWVGSLLTITGSSTLSVDTWYHFALTRSSDTWTLWLNGSSDAVATRSGSVNDSSVGMSIGATGNYNGLYFAGFVRDIRFILNAANYSSTFTPPTEALTAISGTSLLTCHLPYIADGSTNGNTITIVGNTTTKRFGPYDYLGYAKANHGGSVYFDGTGDYLSFVDNANWDFVHSGDFTVNFWMYPTGTGEQAVMGQSNGGGGNPKWGVYINDSTTVGVNKIGFHLGSSNVVCANTFNLTANQWYYIELSRSGDTWYFFVNGDSLGSASSTARPSQSSSDLRIGTDGQDYKQFAGYLTDVRIVTGSALNTSAFTPPTEPLTAITNTQLLTCKNNNFFWDASGVSKRFNLIGTPTASNTQRKFTTSSSLYCGTHAGALSIPSGDYNFDPQSDFTVEAWFYWELASAPFQYTNKTILAFSTSFDGNAWSPLRVNNDYPAKIGFTGSSGGSYSAQLVDHSTWYHIAFVRNGNTIKMYLDGIERLTDTNYPGLSNFGTQHPMNIGSYNPGVGAYTDSWHGYIQDLKISQYAKYTSNFTPPTAEFDG